MFVDSDAVLPWLLSRRDARASSPPSALGSIRDGKVRAWAGPNRSEAASAGGNTEVSDLLVQLGHDRFDVGAPLTLGRTLEHAADTLGEGSALWALECAQGGGDLTFEPAFAQDALGQRGADPDCKGPLQLSREHRRWRDQLAVPVLDHLAVEPSDELRRGHRVQLDAVGLQPLLPALTLRSFVFTFEHVVGNRLALLALLDVFHFEAHFDRFPRL